MLRWGMILRCLNGGFVGYIVTRLPCIKRGKRGDDRGQGYRSDLNRLSRVRSDRPKPTQQKGQKIDVNFETLFFHFFP